MGRQTISQSLAAIGVSRASPGCSQDLGIRSGVTLIIRQSAMLPSAMTLRTSCGRPGSAADRHGSGATSSFGLDSHLRGNDEGGGAGMTREAGEMAKA